MSNHRIIELLAPAKNLECGIEAIRHGADAVYIGAPLFSARAAAGNSIDDIKKLSDYAHLFNAKVYVALNTILNDEELKQTEKLIWNLWQESNIDALIIQDMGITQLNLPPIPLHASTQMDSRTVEKVKFLEDTGFQQIVLARELSIEEIKAIAREVSTPLEAFVHGALCVCYSGQCYLSEALSKRSANKGACAQYCRLPYNLEDASGEEILSKKHLLSMKDLNLSEDLEDLLDAGVSSLKIEGRLKDLSYVKNTVSFYRQKLDEIFKRRTEYKRASSGSNTYNFQPILEKSFNRGFTEYFLHERNSDEIWSIKSPKSTGEFIGIVLESNNRGIKVKTDKQLSNGDGICYFNTNEELVGFQINKVENNSLIFSKDKIDIKKGTKLFRNFDHLFEKQLSQENTADRKIDIHIELTETDYGFSIKATDEDQNSYTLDIQQEKILARTDQSQNVVNNLSKTGNTIFKVRDVHLGLNKNWFIPASLISEWRRQLTEGLLNVRIKNYKRSEHNLKQTSHSFPTKTITYLGNVMNEKAKQFYVQHNSSVLQPAFEKKSIRDVPLMFTRHCIKYSMGWCPREGMKKHPYKEPFYLSYKDTRLQLFFDCKNCEMKVFVAE